MSEQKLSYEPSKSYKWEIDTPFVLTGAEYGLIYNNLLKKKVELLQSLEVLNTLEAKLREAVESGAATEVVAKGAIEEAEIVS